MVLCLRLNITTTYEYYEYYDYTCCDCIGTCIWYYMRRLQASGGDRVAAPCVAPLLWQQLLVAS